MTSRRSRRYWRNVFEGENGDMVKNILTDGKWNPTGIGGKDYKPPKEVSESWFELLLLIILVGAFGFGTWKLLAWIW